MGNKILTRGKGNEKQTTVKGQPANKKQRGFSFHGLDPEGIKAFEQAAQEAHRRLLQEGGR